MHKSGYPSRGHKTARSQLQKWLLSSTVLSIIVPENENLRNYTRETPYIFSRNSFEQVVRFRKTDVSRHTHTHTRYIILEKFYLPRVFTQKYQMFPETWGFIARDLTFLASSLAVKISSEKRSELSRSYLDSFSGFLASRSPDVQ